MAVSTSKCIQNKRRHNPTVRLKVPAGLLAKAVHDKKKTSLLYYYQAKSFRANGLFNRVELVSFLMERTGKCRSTVNDNIAKLIAMGWLNKTAKGYHLVSYDTVWADLAVDLSAEHLSLLYVKPGENDLEQSIILKELWLKQKKQSKAIEKQIICNTYQVTRSELKLSGKSVLKKMRKVALNSRNVETIKQSELNQLRAVEIESVTTDNAITCATFANLFGRTSARTGYKMQQKLKEAGLLKVENRKIRTNVKVKEAGEFYNAKLPSSFSLCNGVIWKQMPNRLTIL